MPREGREGEGRGEERGRGTVHMYISTVCTYICTYVCTHQCACAVQEVSLGVVAVKTLFHEPSCVALVQLGGPGVVLHSQCTLTQLWESVEKGGRGGSGVGKGREEGEEMGREWRSKEETGRRGMNRIRIKRRG